MNSIVQTYKVIEHRLVSQQEPIADPSLADGSSSKTKRTPMLVTSGPREVLRTGAEPMSDHDSRGQESPDRPTHRCCTDGGSSPLGTTQACPECDRTGVRKRLLEKEQSWAEGKRWKCNHCGAEFDEPVTRERESIGGTAGLAGELLRADPDDLVTDGGQEMVWTHSTAAGESITTYHTDRDCPSLHTSAAIVERDPDTLPERATHCQLCADRLGEREIEHDWSYQAALRDHSGDDLVTDGGEEVVFIAAKAGGGTGILHTSQSCPHLKRARKVFKKPRSAYPDDRAICERCRGVISSAGGDNSGPWEQLAEADPDDLVTDGGTIPVCPECDSHDIRQRMSGSIGNSTAPDAATWKCQVCGHAFDDPIERAPEQSQKPRYGPARELFEANPDDLVTDGGAPEPDSFRIPTIADLDAMRVAKGLSQRDLSLRAGCEESRFNVILNKDLDPHTNTLRAFLAVLQDAEPRDDDEIERTGPKPEPSPNADPDPEDFELLSAQLHHSPPDAIGEDPRPPERERDDDLRADGGGSYCAECHRAVAREDRVEVGGEVYHRQCAPDEAVANRQVGEFQTDGGRRRPDHVVATVLEGRRRPSDRLRATLRADGGEELPEPDRAEQERRARQAATSLVAWSSRAGIDPAAVLDEVREGLPRTDGGDPDHYCEICERPFETIARLIKHDCEDRDAPLVTDGGSVTDEVFEILAFCEYGELPVDESEDLATLDKFLRNATGCRLVEGYNDSAGYYVLRYCGGDGR